MCLMSDAVQLLGMISSAPLWEPLTSNADLDYSEIYMLIWNKKSLCIFLKLMVISVIIIAVLAAVGIF